MAQRLCVSMGVANNHGVITALVFVARAIAAAAAAAPPPVLELSPSASSLSPPPLSRPPLTVNPPQQQDTYNNLNLHSTVTAIAVVAAILVAIVIVFMIAKSQCARARQPTLLPVAGGTLIINTNAGDPSPLPARPPRRKPRGVPQHVIDTFPCYTYEALPTGDAEKGAATPSARQASHVATKKAAAGSELARRSGSPLSGAQLQCQPASSTEPPLTPSYTGHLDGPTSSSSLGFSGSLADGAAAAPARPPIRGTVSAASLANTVRAAALADLDRTAMQSLVGQRAVQLGSNEGCSGSHVQADRRNLDLPAWQAGEGSAGQIRSASRIQSAMTRFGSRLRAGLSFVGGARRPIEEPQCPVCLCDYCSGDVLRQLKPCGHYFHKDCIDMWMEGHSTCPLCRANLLPKGVEEQMQLEADREAAAEAAAAEQQQLSDLVITIADNGGPVVDEAPASHSAPYNVITPRSIELMPPSTSEFQRPRRSLGSAYQQSARHSNDGRRSLQVHRLQASSSWHTVHEHDDNDNSNNESPGHSALHDATTSPAARQPEDGVCHSLQLGSTGEQQNGSVPHTL